jgi:hypothetical protein
LLTTPVVAGVVIGIAVVALAWSTGLDRDRAFYPTTLMVIAAYYALFAAMAGSTTILLYEGIAIAAFFAAAIVGFRRSLWLVAFGLAGHGIFDLFHAKLIANPGVPEWWPAFCSAADITLGAIVALMLYRGALHNVTRAG